MPDSRILPLVGVYSSIFQVGKTEAQENQNLPEVTIRRVLKFCFCQ